MLNSGKKRMISMFLIAFLLSFQVCQMEVFAETYQAEAITDILFATGAVITTETAIGFCLSVMGFTAAAQAVYENRDSLIEWCDSLEESFVDFCSKSKDWAEVTAPKIRNWLEGVAAGVIDTVDETYLAFKDWLVDLYNNQTAELDIQGDGKVIELKNFKEYFDVAYDTMYDDMSTKRAWVDVVENYGISQGFNERDASWSGWHYDTIEEKNVKNTHYIAKNTESVFFRFGGTYYAVDFNVNTLSDSFSYGDFPYSYINSDYHSTYNIWDNIQCGIENSKPFVDFSILKDSFCFVRLIASEYFDCPPDNFYTVFEPDIPVDTLTDGYARKKMKFLPAILGYIATCWYHGIAIDGIAFPQDDGLSEEATGKIVVDGSVEDVIERDGSLDNVDVRSQDGTETDKIYVDVGDITIEDIAHPFPSDEVKVVDKAQDIVLPDKTPVDELPEKEDVSSVKDYTVAGLQEVFPFCIPWDFYYLVNVLSAKAEAPYFSFPITYWDDKGKKHTEKIVIDFSEFDTVARILRTMELLAFMIFLTLKTRDLIRG